MKRNLFFGLSLFLKLFLLAQNFTIKSHINHQICLVPAVLRGDLDEWFVTNEGSGNIGSECRQVRLRLIRQSVFLHELKGLQIII